MDPGVEQRVGERVREVHGCGGQRIRDVRGDDLDRHGSGQQGAVPTADPAGVVSSPHPALCRLQQRGIG